MAGLAHPSLCWGNVLIVALLSSLFLLPSCPSITSTAITTGPPGASQLCVGEASSLEFKLVTILCR